MMTLLRCITASMISGLYLINTFIVLSLITPLTFLSNSRNFAHMSMLAVSSLSSDLAQSAAHLTKVWKHFGTSAIFPPKMESLTHVTRGGPHFCAHFAVSPPTQVAKSTRHLIFCKPVAALMHSFSALTQSAIPSSS